MMTIRFPISVMIAIKDRTAVFTINCQEQMLTAFSASKQKDFEVVMFTLLDLLTLHVSELSWYYDMTTIFFIVHVMVLSQVLD